MAHMFIINPLSGLGMDNLFSTHPATERRIADWPPWRRSLQVRQRPKPAPGNKRQKKRRHAVVGIGLGPAGAGALRTGHDDDQVHHRAPQISRALLSVSDKTGLLDLASALTRHGVALISTAARLRPCAPRDMPSRRLPR